MKRVVTATLSREEQNLLRQAHEAIANAIKETKNAQYVLHNLKENDTDCISAIVELNKANMQIKSIADKNKFRL